jgi:hypothetical protein
MYAPRAIIPIATGALLRSMTEGRKAWLELPLDLPKLEETA